MFQYHTAEKITPYLVLKAPRKNCIGKCRLLKSPAYITAELSIEANSVDSEQTAPIGASDLGPHCLPIGAV